MAAMIRRCSTPRPKAGRRLKTSQSDQPLRALQARTPPAERLAHSEHQTRDPSASLAPMAPWSGGCFLQFICRPHRVQFRASAAVERERPRWCAWQESNLLPLAPQASALSGELQAHVAGVQFRRGSMSAVAALNVPKSKLLTTTKAT